MDIPEKYLIDVLEWLATGDVGLSSKCMALHLTTGKTKRINHPLDPSDFNRCLMLLKAAPWLKTRIHLMKDVSIEWSKLIDNWDKLEVCFVNEVGENWKERNKTAPVTYRAMKDLGL